VTSPRARYRLDAGVRVTDGGRTLIGGSPLRILRLTDVGAALVEDIRCGRELASSSSSAAGLLARLVSIGAAHPQPQPRPARPGEVSVVVPTFDHDRGLRATLAALRLTAPDLPVVVVDDGGPKPAATEAIAAQHGATLVRHRSNRGPAAARNTGLARVATPLVVFVDAGCEPQADWLGPLLALLDLSDVAMVAPRIVGRGGDSAVARYEAARSPLDRGAEPGPVRPNTRVPFVPAACLAGSCDVLRSVGGFSEDLRVGEDVDLVWRLVEAGQEVRYEPAARVVHDHRTTAAGMLRRRFAYGTSAALLHERHPGSVRPVAVGTWSVAMWAAAAIGSPSATALIVAGSTGALARRLHALDEPLREAARLALTGNLIAGRAIADALVRAWWPLTALAACTSRRARPAAIAAATLPAVASWLRLRPDVDPARWLVLSLADDVAYATGVWDGCVRRRTVGPLSPELSNWPGRRPAVTTTHGGIP
jgi:mycofactocin system glycosyltransferase